MTKTKSPYYKHPQYGMIYGPDVVTPVLQAAWPYLTKPKDGFEDTKTGEVGQPRYELTLIGDPKSKKFQEFTDEMLAHKDPMVEEFNEGRKAKITVEDDIFKDGNSFKDAEEKYPYYLDKMVIAGRNPKPIKVYGQELDENGQLVEVDAATLEGGMYVKGVMRPIVTGHGLSFRLLEVRIVKDTGERIGGAQRDTTSLLDVTEEEDDVEVEAPAKKAVAAPVKKATGRSAAVNLLS